MFAKMTWPRASVIQISAGTLSAMWRKRASLSRKAASRRRRSVMSRTTSTAPVTRPSLNTGVFEHETSIGVPFLVKKTSSCSVSAVPPEKTAPSGHSLIG
jgi:hypothetical protein